MSFKAKCFFEKEVQSISVGFEHGLHPGRLFTNAAIVKKLNFQSIPKYGKPRAWQLQSNNITISVRSSKIRRAYKDESSVTTWLILQSSNNFGLSNCSSSRSVRRPKYDCRPHKFRSRVCRDYPPATGHTLVAFST